MDKGRGTMINLTDEQKQKLLLEYSVINEVFNNKGILIKTTVVLPKLAELIYNEMGYHFLTTYDNEEIYTYNGRYYEANGEQIIKEATEIFLGDDTTEYHKKEVLGYIRDKNYKKRDIFENNITLLNLENGIYDLKQKKFMEHNPEYHFLNVIPITYKKKR